MGEQEYNTATNNVPTEVNFVGRLGDQSEAGANTGDTMDERAAIESPRGIVSIS